MSFVAGLENRCHVDCSGGGCEKRTRGRKVGE
jgi:hypothetical protein